MIANVQISHAPRAVEGVDYWVDGDGGRLAGLYGELLGLQLIDIGYKKLVHEDGRLPEIGFEYSPDDTRAGWPDPDRPQQVHLDIEVGDLDAAESVVVRWAATPLQDKVDFRTYADPAGHPFCLYLDRSLQDPLPGRLARIVVDAADPDALAAFYEELLEMRNRVLDTAERVEISAGTGGVVLAFQRAQFAAARWPDPMHPAQVHMDLTFVTQRPRAPWRSTLVPPHCPCRTRTLFMPTRRHIRSVSQQQVRGHRGQLRSTRTRNGWRRNVRDAGPRGSRAAGRR